MSASLVGSEMCIRDRGNPPFACSFSHPKPQRLGVIQSGMEARKGALPVSYTHLTLPTICSV
eukprot:12066067-Alexandrium_andersonii.AAC.1